MGYRQAGSLLNSYVARLNQAVAMLSTDRTQAENELLAIIEQLDKNVLSTGNESIINQTGQIFGFIYHTANNNSLTKVQQALQENQKIQSILKNV